MTVALPPVPPDWPGQADEDYERIRILGAGAFGEVWLARSRGPKKDAHFVAIKGVSVQTEAEGATAAREIAILRALRHPNIVSLCHDYAPASPQAKGRYMALSFVDGPDLGCLLEKRGALGLRLSQTIASHLIAAVAYCHARGVMHRDIKPDNILLSGCKGKWQEDDAIWDDGKNNPGRFKAILADFGFARATEAKDFEQPGEGLHGEEHTRAGMQRTKSRFILRASSAVGTKHFAAPEIVTTVRKKGKYSTTSFCSRSHRNECRILSCSRSSTAKASPRWPYRRAFRATV